MFMFIFMLGCERIDWPTRERDAAIWNSELFIRFHLEIAVYFYEPVLLTVVLTCLVPLSILNSVKRYGKRSSNIFEKIFSQFSVLVSLKFVYTTFLFFADVVLGWNIAKASLLHIKRILFWFSRSLYIDLYFVKTSHIW